MFFNLHENGIASPGPGFWDFEWDGIDKKFHVFESSVTSMKLGHNNFKEQAAQVVFVWRLLLPFPLFNPI